jgi:hypothetical protein
MFNLVVLKVTTRTYWLLLPVDNYLPY